VRTFVEIFWGCVLEVIIFISPKFELLWTSFDRKIIKFSEERGLEKRLWTRTEFFPAPVEPTSTFFCVGSTGEWSFLVLGFLGFSVVAPVHQTLHAPDQPVLLLNSLFRSFNRRTVFPRRRINR